ncbi:MAG: hypothetical protein HKN86_03970 [Acidimicrobiia bacterium]|nr:hypothetical protein [Acidimicrobiia bacterium]
MKSFKDIRTKNVEESSAAWAKSLETIAKKKQLDKISDKDKKTLMKIAAMMAKEQVDEAPLVMADAEMASTLFKQIKDDIFKNSRKKQEEKNWPVLQTLAKLAGYGITKNGQAKGKSFRYDLKKK